MISFVLVTSVLLAGQNATAPKAKATEKAATKIAPSIDPGEALAKYNELRDKTPPTAAAHWKLGLWCEQHGLNAEAYLHFAEVVRRDPKRDAAWRKLGFKKYGRRWTTDEQIAGDNEQKKADKVWGPRLRKVHKDIHGAHGITKRDEAQTVLDAISDPGPFRRSTASLESGAHLTSSSRSRSLARSTSRSPRRSWPCWLCTANRRTSGCSRP